MKTSFQHVVTVAFLWTFVLVLGVPFQGASKEVDYINIYNPFLNKTPIAVTRFKPFNDLDTEIESGKEAQDIMTQALGFTGYLKIMDPAAFLANPSETGIQLSQINFKDWTAIGADLLITGGIEDEQGMVKLKLRLFDTFNAKLLVGKVYTGPKSQIRKMVHMFCSEISYKLTGKWGVFSSKIAFVSTASGHKEIYTCEFDGFDVKQVTHHKSICLSPDWSFDGNWLAYVSYAKGKPDIYIKNLKENRGTVINHKGMNISPDWMPGQLKLAAALSFSGSQEIYLLTRTGEIIKKISQSYGINVSPRFSPDGTKIAFTSNRGGTPQIYVKDLSSGDERRVTFQGKYNTSPAWSPDGSRIAYVGIEKNQIDLFVIKLGADLDAGIGVPIQLTRNQGDNEDSTWSPDGSLIAFSSTREGGVAKIFVMTAAGTDQRRLFSFGGKQTQPCWSQGGAF